MSPSARLVLPLLALVLSGLSACGLAPVYSGGSSSPAAVMLTQIEIAPIPDRPGFLVRQALLDRFGTPAADPRYRLEVALDDQIVAFGVRGDNSAARERRTLRARYRLVDAASNAVLLDATAGSDIGIDRVSSNYAVVAAETTALERLSTEIASQITARLALFARAAPQ
ncbi:MAG: LPS assembly lipoprotein LptE [Polymorphobacter sp.]